MRRGESVEFWIAVVALLVAVWAVVLGVRSERWRREHAAYLQTAEAHMMREGFSRTGDGFYSRITVPRGAADEFAMRLRALEEDAAEREKVWRSIVTAENDQPWKELDLLRTPRGDKPTIRNVRTPDGED